MDYSPEINQRHAPQRLEYADAIRALAIIGVLMVHTTSPLVRSAASVKSSWLAIGCGANAIGHAAVPLFIMISGLLLLDPSRVESVSAFLRKRLLRILIPFILWAIIYLVWISIVNHTPLEPVDCLRKIAGVTVYTQFWFIKIILGLYLVSPILKVLVKETSDTVLWYLIGLWFFAVLLEPVLEQITGTQLGISFAVVTGYVGYFILGYALGRIRTTPLVQIIAAGILVVCWIGDSLITGISEKNPIHEPVLDLLGGGYLTPAVCLMSVSVFILVKSVSFEKLYKAAPVARKVIAPLSATSFGIFFMHMIPLEILRYGSLGFTLNATVIHPIVGIPCTVAAVGGICAGAALFCNKIPLIKLLFP